MLRSPLPSTGLHFGSIVVAIVRRGHKSIYHRGMRIECSRSTSWSYRPYEINLRKASIHLAWIGAFSLCRSRPQKDDRTAVYSRGLLHSPTATRVQLRVAVVKYQHPATDATPEVRRGHSNRILQASFNIHALKFRRFSQPTPYNLQDSTHGGPGISYRVVT